MKSIQVTSNEVRALNRLAYISKMDCWFFIADNGKTFDLESSTPNKPKNNKRMISQLLDGATMEDLALLSSEMCYHLLKITLKL